jgi:FAD/FMN-containing dehydrogenase
MGCDNLLEAGVVLADGSIVNCSEDENKDLFWAMRGAGSAFGIVTKFVLRAYNQKNLVWASNMGFARSQLPGGRHSE